MALCKQIENNSMLFHKDKKPMKGIFSPCKKNSYLHNML